MNTHDNIHTINIIDKKLNTTKSSIFAKGSKYLYLLEIILEDNRTFYNISDYPLPSDCKDEWYDDKNEAIEDFNNQTISRTPNYKGWLD